MRAAKLETGSSFCSTRARKSRGQRRKISPKSKQFVLVLFLLAAFGGVARQVRSCCGSKRAPTPWVRPIRWRCTGTTGSSMEAAVGRRVRRGPAARRAAFELQAGERVERGQPACGRAAGARFRRSCSDLLSACVEYSRESEGAFDITVGPLMKVWGFYKGTGHLPHRAEVLAALDQSGLPAYPAGPGSPDGAVRPAGCGAGPGRYRQRLRGRPHGGCFEDRTGSRSALVAASGSSIYGMGAPPDEPSGWRVKIRDPWMSARRWRRSS